MRCVFILIVILESISIRALTHHQCTHSLKYQVFTGTTQTRFGTQIERERRVHEEKVLRSGFGIYQSHRSRPVRPRVLLEQIRVLRRVGPTLESVRGRAKMRGIETRLCERVLSIRFCLVQVRILPRFYPRVYARAHVGPEELGVDGRHGRSQVGAKEED